MAMTLSGSNGITFNDASTQSTGKQACKAWVNFNGVTTVTVRDSFNVSSVTRQAAGQYTINFTTAMANLNYATVGQAWYAGASGGLFSVEGPPSSTTSKVISLTNPGATANIDLNHINVVFFSS